MKLPHKTAARIAGGVLIALLLGGCAGGQGLTTGGGAAAANAQAPETGMAGRWMLTAPNAPMCGMNFTGGAAAKTGKVSPEGGCPGNFYLSRTWALDQDTLVINDDANNALVRLSNSGGRFEGTSAAGLPVTLARPPAPPQ